MCGGDKLKTGGRSGAIDMVRVLAMLAIIKEHSSLNEPFWHIYGAFLGAGAGVVFFFFAAALFLKFDASAVYKRSGWLLACYIFWGVMAWWLLTPHSYTSGTVHQWRGRGIFLPFAGEYAPIENHIVGLDSDFSQCWGSVVYPPSFVIHPYITVVTEASGMGAGYHRLRFLGYSIYRTSVISGV